MTTTFNFNLSAEAPVFNITLGDSVSFSVSASFPTRPLAHKNTHSIGGTDELKPSDIGAQSLFESGITALQTVGQSVSLTSARAKNWAVNVYAGGATSVVLPSSGVQAGDIAVLKVSIQGGGSLAVKMQMNGYQATLATITKTGSIRYISPDTTGQNWTLDGLYIHTHTASEITDFTAAVTAIVNSIVNP